MLDYNGSVDCIKQTIGQSPTKLCGSGSLNGCVWLRRLVSANSIRVQLVTDVKGWFEADSKECCTT